MQTHPLLHVTALLATALTAFAQPTNFENRPAIFQVTTGVVTPALEPFTVTMPAFGNTLNRDSQDGFEPVTFRTQIIVGQDSPDRIIPADKNQIDFFNSWASGYLDGATVHIYRIINGKMTLVRTDKVASGGTVIANWNYNSSQVTKPNVTRAQWNWAPWSRPGSTDYFTVIAVDKAGNQAPGIPVSLTRPDAEMKGKPQNDTTNFRADGRLAESDKEAPPPPQNVRATITPDFLVELTWDAVDAPDLAGYFIAQSDVNPAEHKGVYLQLASSSATPAQQIKAGDLVIVDHEYYAFDRKYRSNRTANLWRTNATYYPGNLPNEFYPGEIPGKTWTLRDHVKDTPVTEAGRTYLEMTLRAGDTEKIGKSGIPDISNSEQDYYPVPEDTDYIMEVWLKADRPDAPPVIFETDGDPTIGGFVTPTPLQPTTEWKKSTHTFRGASSAKGFHAYFVLTCQGPATYSIDNYRIYRADTPYLGLLPQQIARYKESGMMAMRTHGPIKTGQTTYSMDAFTNPGGVIQGVPCGNTLPQQLTEMAKVGTRPWLQIEYHMSPEEWLGFIEFMAAPYDPAKGDTPATKPWAAKRYAQGRTAPWTDAFDRIYFELGNETWNGLFAPWVFPFGGMIDGATGEKYNRGEIYGKMQDLVAATLRSSPYWTPELEKKFIHVMGGWANGTYTEEIAKSSTVGDFLTIAAYNGGWDEGEGIPQENPASYFNILSQANATAVHRARANYELTQKYPRNGDTWQLGTYEAGPGYALNGLNNDRVSKEQAAQQERVMKSKIAGTATIDSFLTHANYGFTLQNFFTFEEGDLWKSHAKTRRGGQAYPSFLTLSMFNRLATGDLLASITKSVSTVDLPKLRRRAALDNAPLAAVFATRQDDRVNVFCINRAYPGYPVANAPAATPFGLELPFKTAAKITLYKLTGELTDHNIDAERVKVEAVALPPESLREDGRFVIDPATGGVAGGMPAGEVYLYVFEGTDIGPKGRQLTPEEMLARPLGFTPAEPTQ